MAAIPMGVAMGATEGAMMRRRVLAVLSFCLLLASQVAAVAFSTPERTGWVTDAAHILDANSLDALATRLENLQSETGDEVVVVTLPDLQGTTIENWGNVLGDNWKIGKANGRENGVLLIVAPADRKVRIAVGHGLANRLSDSIAAGIVSDHIIPYFRSGDMGQGIRAGIDSIALQLGASAANGVEQASYSNAAPPVSFWSWLHYTLTPSRHAMVISFWVLVVLIVLIFMILNAANVGGGGSRRSGWYSDNYYGSSWGGGSSSSSGSSWGGGGSSGGSFGGGATGSW
jgi:uncharacterized protein